MKFSRAFLLGSAVLAVAACKSDPALAKGLSTHEGALLSEQVATDLDKPFTDPASLLA